MSKSSNKSFKDSQSIKEMSQEAQELCEKLLDFSKTTKVKTKIVNNNDVNHFIDLDRSS